MRKLLFIIFLLLFFSSIWLSLTNQNNIVMIELLGYHIEISIILATISFFVAVTLVFYLFYFFLFIQSIPQSLKKYFKEKQDHQDLSLLINGFSSIHQEDLNYNNQLLKKLISHKDDPALRPLNNIVALLICKSNYFQYKHNSNYIEVLEDSYINLLQYDDMKITALKGLVKLRIENKRYYDALIYAEKAYALSPKLLWLIKDLIIIYSELGIYEKADYIINKALGYKFISKSEANALLIKNFLTHANHLIANSEVEQAIELIEKALKIDPACYDAIFTLAGLHQESNKYIYKIIEKAWKIKPSSELAQLLYNKSKDEILNKRIKLLENLIDCNTNANEGYLMLAELYLEEKMTEQAKKVMEKLLALHAPDFKAIKLMSLIEAKSHSNHNIIINWLNKL